MIRTYNAFREFVEFHRNEINPMAYVKYEELVNKWESEGKATTQLQKLGTV